jgi:hypothetical protein
MLSWLRPFKRKRAKRKAIEILAEANNEVSKIIKDAKDNSEIILQNATNQGQGILESMKCEALSIKIDSAKNDEKHTYKAKNNAKLLEQKIISSRELLKLMNSQRDILQKECSKTTIILNKLIERLGMYKSLDSLSQQKEIVKKEENDSRKNIKDMESRCRRYETKFGVFKKIEDIERERVKRVINIDKEISKKGGDADREISKKKDYADGEISKKKEDADGEISKKKEDADREILKKRGVVDREISKKRGDVDREISKRTRDFDKIMIMKRCELNSMSSKLGAYNTLNDILIKVNKVKNEKVIQEDIIREIERTRAQYEKDIGIYKTMSDLQKNINRLKDKLNNLNDSITVAKNRSDTQSIFSSKFENDVKVNLHSLLCSNEVVWQYEDNGFHNYLDGDSKKIEGAYGTYKRSIILETNNFKYNIDLIELKQENMKTDKIRKIKRSLVPTYNNSTSTVREAYGMALTSFKHNVPQFLGTEKDDLKSGKIDMIEYKLELNSEIGQLITYIFKHYKLTVNQLYRVYNPQLHETYETFTRKIDGEMLFVHGSNPGNMPSIGSHGLKQVYAAAGNYGKGIYFTDEVIYSTSTSYGPPDDNGFHHLLLCRVATGKIYQASKIMTELRVAPKGYNSVKGKSGSTDVWTVYNDAQIDIVGVVYCKKM